MAIENIVKNIDVENGQYTLNCQIDRIRSSVILINVELFSHRVFRV